MLDPFDGGEGLGLWKPDVGTDSWQKLKTYSQSWPNQGLRYYKGAAQYRTQANVPSKYKGRKICWWLGGVDETPKIWVNGTPLPELTRGAAPIGHP